MTSPKIYLDTCIIRDCFKDRNKHSLDLLEEIEKKQINCISSIYAILEFLGIEQDFKYFEKSIGKNEEINSILRNRHKKNLTQAEFEDIDANVRKFFGQRQYKDIKFVSLTGNGWELGLKIALYSNIENSDALHLAAALGERCDFLVTNDTFFIKETKNFIKTTPRKLKICKPEEVKL